jgi:hypothetical protein
MANPSLGQRDLGRRRQRRYRCTAHSRLGIVRRPAGGDATDFADPSFCAWDPRRQLVGCLDQPSCDGRSPSVQWIQRQRCHARHVYGRARGGQVRSCAAPALDRHPRRPGARGAPVGELLGTLIAGYSNANSWRSLTYFSISAAVRCGMSPSVPMPAARTAD